MPVVFGEGSENILSEDFTEVTLSGIDVSEVKDIMASSNMDAIIGLIDSISSDVDKLLKYRSVRRLKCRSKV